jgi:putative tricarboxylic transport membrane protein
MKKRDIISSLFWIGFGTFFCVGAVQNGIMLSPGVPGPGCLAFIVGSILIGLSLFVLIPAVSTRGAAAEPSEAFFPHHESLRKLSIAILSLIGYATAVEPLGFVITTLLFLLFVLAFIEPQKGKTILIFAGLTTLLAYALFTALKVELPKGLWGI